MWGVQNMRQKMWFSYNGVSPPPPNPYVCQDACRSVDTIALFKRLRPRVNMQSILGNCALAH